MQSVPIAQKYLSCVEFDQSTGECVSTAWVDPPGVLPVLTPEDGAAFALLVGMLWVCVAAFHPIQDAARDS